ncbi:SDR family NAD(P)-dependent oxidoreductase [Falsiruegeria mediterranea]|uniref:3-oxoacyl-[acyl-carrier-protein] reductase FabG n=1 Tax=Falsiruegeria mediterranea M17 TaxID=1200281 RepID=A0A2R8C9P2_9RHOB|nr:SDR family oxidoreductase [Falsiruegeria mediterranea]SPJ29149.1 3-oxoacyl-[acyl-carrier-protein] reductase FabG [Falsiruegeria mediterranea M17]
MTSLAGQVALITGASAPRGIGRAIAVRLAQGGARVVVTDTEGPVEIEGKAHQRSDLLNQLALQIGGLAVTLDVTKPDQIAGCIETVHQALGPVDILVNNAGSLAGSDNFLSTTPAQWQASFAVNLLGPMQLAQAVIPAMQAKGAGRIINIGSTGSLGAEPGFGAYTAMKHGLVGLSKTLAAEFGPDGILCNTVCPGYIATDMHMAANARLSQEQGVSLDEMKRRRYADVALRDAGTPEDVAEAVAYLAGPAGCYVTGINLPVTGGVPYGI